MHVIKASVHVENFLDFKKAFDTVNNDSLLIVNLHTMELEAKLIIGFTHI